MMNPDPLEPIVKIGERLREKAAELGLDVQAFAVLPDFSGGQSHALQVVFTLTEAAMGELVPEEELPPELANQDPELAAMFDDIISGSDQAEAEALREAARQQEADKTSAAVEKMLAMRARLAEGKPPVSEEGDDSGG